MAEDIPTAELEDDHLKLSRCGMLEHVQKAFTAAEEGGCGEAESAVQDMSAAKDVYGASCLTWAVRNGYKELGKFLVSKDGDLESNSYGGLKVSAVNIESMPSETQAKPSLPVSQPLHHAVNQNQESMMQYFTANKATLSDTTEAGNSALHFAAGRGVVRMCRTLLEAGADSEARNNAGQSALHIAAANGFDSLIPLFVEYDCDMDAVDKKGNSALHLAVLCGHKEVAACLLKAGCKPLPNK